jgi:hypothetical protein
MRRSPGGCWLAPPCGARTLAAAGNAHTPASPTGLGTPLGGRLDRQRPGILQIRIRYGRGRFRKSGSRQFDRRDAGELVLDLPVATDAVVPQRP